MTNLLPIERNEFLKQMELKDQDLIMKQCTNSYEIFKRSISCLNIKQNPQLQPQNRLNIHQQQINKSSLVQQPLHSQFDQTQPHQTTLGTMHRPLEQQQQQQIGPQNHQNKTNFSQMSSVHCPSVHSMGSLTNNQLFFASQYQQQVDQNPLNQKCLNFNNKYDRLLKIQIPSKEPQLKSILKNSPLVPTQNPKPQKFISYFDEYQEDKDSVCEYSLPSKPYSIHEQPKSIDDYLKQLHHKIQEEEQSQYNSNQQTETKPKGRRSSVAKKKKD